MQRKLEDAVMMNSKFVAESIEKANEAGGTSLVARCRLRGKPNIVCCLATFRSHTWGEVHARTDTLFDQPPYLVTRGWKEVVPEEV